MNNLMIDEIKVEDMIYEINGKQVMIDSDLARLYNVETKRINEAVSRNSEKFPNRFSWILSDEEWSFLRSHFATLEINEEGRGKHRKYLPRVFTEQGVAMLATILKSKVAIQTSIKIMDAFVEMRKYLSNSLISQKYYNDMTIRHNSEIKLLQESFNMLNKKEKVNTIFYENQIYDAYSVLMDILNKAEEEIIIIDNYAGKELLDILKNINKKIIIISKNFDDILISKYKKQYSNIEFKINDFFHDRFIIIDKKKLYNSGSSFKDLGKKCFAINKIKETDIIKGLLEKIN